MYKVIPGNHRHLISLDGKIVGIGGIEGTLPTKDGNVFIEMFGKTRWVDITWLSLISHYEVMLDEEKTFNITFTDTHKKLTCSTTGKIMVFKKPMLIYQKYRIIPNFTSYAISKEGEIIKVNDQEKINIKKVSATYPYCYIYNPEKSKFACVYIHRLVALAWVKNNDYLIKCSVNHIDGNKENFYYRNLEWVSYLDNNLHAIENGLRTDNQPCKILDIKTKEIHRVPSICQAALFMGLRSRFSFDMIAYPPKLFNGRYEVKKIEDETPWFYEKHDKPICRGRYIIEVIHPDGRKETYHDAGSLIKQLKLYNVHSGGIDAIVQHAYKKYPGIRITYTDLYPTKPVQAMNIVTGNIIEAESIREMARILNMSKSSIKYRVKANDNVVVNGHVFRYKSNDSWNKDFNHKIGNAVCLLATNTMTGEEIKFESLKKAANYFGFDKRVIQVRLRDNRNYGHWSFKEIK